MQNSHTPTEALLISGLDTLQARHEDISSENITQDLFREFNDENHILPLLLRKREITYMAVKNSYPYKMPITKDKGEDFYQIVFQ